MRCSQLVLFALPLVGLAQGAAVRRDNDGHEPKHHEEPVHPTKCEPEKIYVTAPPEKHYVTHYNTKTEHKTEYKTKTVEGPTKTEHKVEYKTVEGPTKYVTKVEHKVETAHVTKTKEGEKVYVTLPPKIEYIHKTEKVYVTQPAKTEYKYKTVEGPTKYVTKVEHKVETAHVTKTKEGEKVYVTLPPKTEYKYKTEKVYVTQPAKTEYKHKTVTVTPTPKCTVTAKPSVWPQPVDCHHGKDMYGDKCDEKAPAPTTYAHWDYKQEHCYTTWDNKYEPTKVDEHKPKETHKDDGKKDHHKDDGKDDDSYSKGH